MTPANPGPTERSLCQNVSTASIPRKYSHLSHGTPKTLPQHLLAMDEVGKEKKEEEEGKERKEEQEGEK